MTRTRLVRGAGESIWVRSRVEGWGKGQRGRFRVGTGAEVREQAIWVGRGWGK